MPDLDFRVKEYLADKQDANKKNLANEHIRKLTQEWLHLSVWDYDRLHYELESLGFTSIQRSSCGNGRDPLLLFDLKERAFESLYVEASKPA